MLAKNTSNAELQDSLLRYVKQTIERESGVEIGEKLSVDSPLQEHGIDSFSLLEIILFIERCHGVKLPLEILTAENTHSVSTLVRCVTAHSTLVASV